MTEQIFEHDLRTLTPLARQVLAREPGIFIGGSWHKGDGAIPVIDPSSGAVISQLAMASAADVDLAVQAAQFALHAPEWAGAGPALRERLLLRLAGLVEEHAETLAQIETVDNGMPGWFAFGPDIMGAAEIYRYYAGWPSKLVGESMDVSGPPGSGSYIGVTRREPVGVVAAIVPWNVPFMMMAWKLAPALAAGCSVVLKPATEACLSALLLADLVQQAGFPAGVVNVITGSGPETGEALVRHPGVAKISFTGSTAVGRHIAAIAGRDLKKITLELGGKSPTIIFADADLDAAIVGAANSIFFNSGQICVAGSRLYVEDAVYDSIVKKLSAHIKTLKIGAGLNADVFMGPVVSAKQQQTINAYVASASADGCEIIQGSPVPDGKGYFISPTIILGATDDSRVSCEEIFGPVLAVYRFSSIDEVISRANASDYGLAATIWSRDIHKIMKVASALQCGKVIVNNSGFPYAGLPEGGYKSSGYGRDLGREAVEACLQTKSVLIKT